MTLTQVDILNLQENIPLAPLTTMKIGGPARWFFVGKTTDAIIYALVQAQKNNVPYVVLGSGANVLIADKGFPGLVIQMKNDHYEFHDDTVTAEAGTPLMTLVMQAAKRGLSGLEFGAGIPATVGGAVRGNAGSMGSEMKNIITEVDVLLANGERRKLTNATCEFSYRNSHMKQNKEIVLAATMKLQHADPQIVQRKVKENFSKKHKTQDLKYPSSGCIFMNPKSAKAGQLIEDVGLKGFQIGGVQVSNIHANFIINKDKATAEDVIMLISIIKQKVRVKHNIQLHEEIQLIGF